MGSTAALLKLLQRSVVKPDSLTNSLEGAILRLVVCCWLPGWLSTEDKMKYALYRFGPHSA